MLSENRKLTTNPMVILREDFDDWAILFNGETGEGFGLNPTAVFVWKCMEQGQTVAQLIKQVEKFHYEIPASMETEIQTLVDRFIENGLAGTIES